MMYTKVGQDWYWDTGSTLERLPPEFATRLERGEITDAERLVVLMEECGEVIQAAAKILRYGWHSNYDDGTPNVIRLRDEMDDVQGMIWGQFTRLRKFGSERSGVCITRDNLGGFGLVYTMWRAMSLRTSGVRSVTSLCNY